MATFYKKIVVVGLLTIALVLSISAINKAEAAFAWYKCTVLQVGSEDSTGTGVARYFIQLTDTNGAFTAAYCLIDNNIANQALATALTALSMGQQVNALVDTAQSPYPPCNGIYLASN